MAATHDGASGAVARLLAILEHVVVNGAAWIRQHKTAGKAAYKCKRGVATKGKGSGVKVNVGHVFFSLFVGHYLSKTNIELVLAIVRFH